MKLNTFYIYIVIGIAFSFFTGCDDAKLSEIDNGLYIEEAAPSNKFTQQIEAQLVNVTDITKSLTARLARPINKDITVTFGLDAEIIKEYNEENGSNYELLPDSYLSFEKSVVIPAGKLSAPSVFLTIKPFNTPNGEAYAIPIKITSVSEGISLVGNANKVLYLLTSPNKQKTVVLSGARTASRFKTPFITPSWTVEYWIKVNNHRDPGSNRPWEGPSNIGYRRQFFVDNGSPISFDGLLLRYWADGAKGIMPTLQCQLDGAYIDSSEFWRADTWYHITYTYDGEYLRLYKDGVLDGELIYSKDFKFEGINFCTNTSSWGGGMQTEFAQIRLWDKALSQHAIAEGMSRQIAGDSENLLGYWKCDDAEGKLLIDSTPNENHIEIAGSISWSENTRNFYEPNN